MLKDKLKEQYKEYHEEIDRVAHELSDSIEETLKSLFVCSKYENKICGHKRGIL